MSRVVVKRALGILALGALAVVLAGGCLPDDPPVNGRLLYPGPEVVAPRFRTVDNEAWVLFDVRIAPADDGLAPHYDLHLARWTDGEHRLVLGNRADREEWPLLTDADRAGFYMVDERVAPGLALPAATLVRLRLATGVVETIDDVTQYGLDADRRHFYYRRVSDASLPDLHLRDLAGTDRELGPSAGAVAFRGADHFYFLGGTDRVLSRVSGLDGKVEALRPHVSRFALHDQETFAVLSVSEPGQGVFTRILDLATAEERALPVDNPCCWLGFDGGSFVYAEAASGDQPAQLHRYEFASATDRAVTMPAGLADVKGIIDRPQTTQTLVFDGEGRAALLGLSGDSAGSGTLLPMLVSAPVFSSDGRYLLYLDEEPPPPPPAVRRNPVGRLMVLDASDPGQPPQALSPLGTSCFVDPRGYEPNVGGPDKVLFWAYYGLGATDLYLSDLDTHETRKLAVGVGPMTMEQSRLLGVARVGQDHTGDLVQKDLVTGAEQVLEHGVLTMATRTDPMLGEIATFVIRERAPSSPRNGLWAIPLPPL